MWKRLSQLLMLTTVLGVSPLSFAAGISASLDRSEATIGEVDTTMAADLRS